MLNGLRTYLAATALFGVLAIGSQAYAVFPEFENFENDIDSWTPGTAPDYYYGDHTGDVDFGNSNYPVSYDFEPEFEEIRNGTHNGIVEEIPSGWNGITASHGNAMGWVQIDGGDGPQGNPAKQLTPIGTAFSFQTDVYTDPAMKSTFAPAVNVPLGSNGVPDFWWTNAVQDNSGLGEHGNYLTESGLTAEVIETYDPDGPGTKFWRITTTAGGNPHVDIPLGTWVTLETVYHRNADGKLGITDKVWNQDHTELLLSVRAPNVFQAPDYDQMGGPLYTWFVYSDSNQFDPTRNFTRVIIDDLGVGVPIYILGDMDGDGDVDNFDIQPFELALTDPEAYEIAYGLPDAENRGDIDQDGDLDNFDIQPFENLLTSQGPSGAAAVPEPGTFALMGLGLIGVAFRCRRRKAA